MRFLLAILLSITVINNVAAEQSSNKKPTIIALSPHIVEMLYAIGAGDQIVGTTDFADYPEQAKNIPRIGNHARIQIERVVEINPDVIISWHSGNPVDDLEKITRLGFKVVYSQPNTLIDVAKELLMFGELSGQQQKAKQVADSYMTKLDALREQYKDKSKISVFYELWSNPLSTIAKGAWPQLHLDLCGAYNPFYNAVNSYPHVSIEQVVKEDIQLIISPRSGNQTDKVGYDWKPWKLLKAVQHQQFIRPNADMLHRMTPRVLDELIHLCQKIDQTRVFYQKLNLDKQR